MERFALQTWEWAVLGGAALGLWVHRGWWPKQRERWVARVPEGVRALAAHPRALWVLDGVLIALLLVLVAPPLFVGWEALNALRDPAGPDSGNYLGTALAFETGRWHLAFEDRYPGHPWLVSLLAQDPLTVGRVGTELSMWCTVLTAVPLYALGTLMAGRAAGFVGAWVGLRQILALDVGQSFTAYPLMALQSLTLLCLTLWFTRTGRGSVALAAGLLGAFACATDPKQIPLVLALLGLCSVWALARAPGDLGVRLRRVLLLLTPLPVMNYLVGKLPLDLLSLEGILYRTPITMVGDGIRDHIKEGFTLGADDAWQTLVPSFVRVFTELGPKDGAVMDPRFLNGIPLLWPDTSYAWGAGVVLVPIWLAWRWRRRPGGWTAVLLVVVYWASMGSTLRVHYANRYLQPHALAVPGAITAVAQGVLGGGAVVAGGLVAVLLPESPYSRVDEGYAATPTTGADQWVSSGGGKQMRTLAWAVERLPEDMVLFDFTMVEPPIYLAAGFTYRKCAREVGDCLRAIPGQEGPFAVIVRAGEELSARLPDATGQPFNPPPPPRLGECWHLRRKLGPKTGLYVWRCAEGPTRQHVITVPPSRPKAREHLFDGE